jgi:hypothetical protein
MGGQKHQTTFAPPTLTSPTSDGRSECVGHMSHSRSLVHPREIAHWRLTFSPWLNKPAGMDNGGVPHSGTSHWRRLPDPVIAITRKGMDQIR